MGAIISLLRTHKIEDVYIDFANVRPTERETALYEQAQAVLDRAPEITAAIEAYAGAQDLVRRVMGKDVTRDEEEEAFVGVLRCVEQITMFYEYSISLEAIVPRLLQALGAPEAELKQSVQDQQALARQLAEIMDFALRFDQLRMMRPFLPNDFSFYRRLLSKFPRHPQVKLSEDENNVISMFTAQHIPMMTALSTSVRPLNPQGNITNALACMANSCLQMLKSKRVADERNRMLCARAMTGALVLFDHVDPLGAFHRKSVVCTKDIITMLKSEFPEHDALTNAIKFSTKHFRDDSTPSNIQELLA